MFGMSGHVETVVLLSHKKADSYIHIDVEFGEGEGKIPVDSIAKRAEAYKPKEKVTYKIIFMLGFAGSSLPEFFITVFC